MDLNALSEIVAQLTAFSVALSALVHAINKLVHRDEDNSGNEDDGSQTPTGDADEGDLSV